MEWLTLLAIPFLITILWLYTVSVARSKVPIFRNKAIVLLIAHPDDEAMFFGPTLLALTEPSLGNHLKILCLSSGDADGLGEIRKKELAKSGKILGLKSEEDVYVVDSSEFPDSMTSTWPASAIAATLTKGFIEPLQPKTKPSTPSPPKSTIQVLITFDSKGVSSHPNHISLHHGARHFIHNILRQHPGYSSPISLYTLTSIPIWRKYISIFDCLFSFIAVVLSRRKKSSASISASVNGNSNGNGIGRDGKEERESRLLFLSGWGEIQRAREAMWKAHKSQMRWFRWGWIVFSRYMVVNDLVLEDVK